MTQKKFELGQTVVLNKDFNSHNEKGQRYKVVEVCQDSYFWLDPVLREVKLERLVENYFNVADAFDIVTDADFSPTTVFYLKLTGRQLAKIYAIMGISNGRPEADIFHTVRALLKDENQEKYWSMFDNMTQKDRLDYIRYEQEWLDLLFKPEETEQEKQIKVLKETIAKASEQIRQLENMK